MPPLATTAVLLALALDSFVGEFPDRVHPIALFGTAIHPLGRDWPTPRIAGLAIAVIVPLSVAILLAVATVIMTRFHPVLGAGFAGLVLFSTTSLRRLLTTARGVIDDTATDPDHARAAIHALVGRDPTALSPAELRSAALESVSENLADGLVAPLLTFTVGAAVSLPIAVGATTWVKAINTFDSMIGYHDCPLGWASARLDDAVMWLPARLTAGLIALAAVDPRILVSASRFARNPASPNSGWPMATLAVALETQLRKPGEYRLNDHDSLPTIPTAHRGLRMTRTAGLLAFLAAGGIAWF